MAIQPFVGKAKHKVDAKGRVSLPSNFRFVAQEGDLACTDKQKGKCKIVLMHGRKSKCLMGYSIESYADLCAQVNDLGDFSEEGEELQDIVYENADYFEVDDAGRMGLKEMRGHVGDDDHVIFVGRGKHFEIWEPAAYEAMRAARSVTAKSGDPFRALRRPRKAEAE